MVVMDLEEDVVDGEMDHKEVAEVDIWFCLVLVVFIFITYWVIH